jgi:hypothetical protein
MQYLQHQQHLQHLHDSPRAELRLRFVRSRSRVGRPLARLLLATLGRRLRVRLRAIFRLQQLRFGRRAGCAWRTESDAPARRADWRAEG